MIDRETLNDIAKLYKLRPWQQEKHYVQTMVLVALSEFPIIFKGGTYLWFFHGLNRFSEDLDFTASGELPENIADRVSDALRMFGVENTIKIIERKKRGISFRISAKGPLNTSPRDVCHVYVEISRREKIVQEPLSFELNFDAYKLPVKIIQGATLGEVAAEKIRAMITRRKARDMYDLFYLIKNKNVDFDLELTNEKLKYYELNFSDELFTKKLDDKKDIWKAELKQLVFGKLPEYTEVQMEINEWITKR